MVEIEVVLDDSGVLRACKARGHAKFGKYGDDRICTIISLLLFSASSSLADREGIKFNGDLPEKGQLWLEVDYEAEGKEFLFAVGVFLMEGLKFVAQEYPKNCKLTIRRK